MNLLHSTRDQVVEIVDLTQTLTSHLAASLYANARDKAAALSVPEIAQRVEVARSALKGAPLAALVSSVAGADVGKIARTAIPEIVELTTRLFSDAAANAYGRESDKSDRLSTREIDHRLDVAADALKGRAPLPLASSMVQSYTFDHKTGISTFTLPAEVGDEKAMLLINAYLKKYYSIPWGMPFREAISEEALDWFSTLSDSASGDTPGPVRQCREARHITIHSLAKGTIQQDEATQVEALRENALVFSDPWNLAIAAGLHACKFKGQDLFAGQEVRCSVKGIALYSDWKGVRIRFNVADTDKRFSAAGTPVDGNV